MRRFRLSLIALLIAVGFSGCKSTELPSPPSGVPDTVVMKPILIEVLLAEAWVQQSRLKGDSLRIVSQTEYARIADKYGLEDSLLLHSLRWYAQHPEWLNPMLNEVMDSLQTLSAKSR